MRGFILGRFGWWGMILGMLMTWTVPLSAQTAISQALQPYVDASEMPGFVSVLATADKILQVDCVGWADVEAKKPMTPDTLFWIASTTKVFTAAAAMTLVDEGKLNLDDPIDRYFPELKNLQVAEKQENGTVVLRPAKSIPTVRQCLCHVTGWPYCTPFMERFGIDSLPLEKMVFTFAHTPLNADPGEQYVYSQMGVDTVGAIVEKIAGMPYAQFLQERFFTPLEMKDTTFWPSQALQKERLVKAYSVLDGKLTPVEIPILRRPYEDSNRRCAEPGGGIFTTANDLVKFFQMLAARGMYQGKQYLSEAAVAEIGRKQTPENVDSQYGLCALLRGKWFGHNGMLRNMALINTEEGGLVKLWMVQVLDCPKKRDAEAAWNTAADASFRKLLDFYREDYGNRVEGVDDTFWWCDATQKVWRGRDVPTAAAPLQISAAANDAESIQCVLRPKTAQNLERLEISEFQNTLGQTVDIATEFRYAYYHRIQFTTDGTGVRDEYPDALPPVTLPMALEAERNQPFWLTVRIPAGTPAGDYTATLRFQLEGSATQEIPITVHVWNFELPAANHVATAFGMWPNLAWQYHGVTRDEDRRKVTENYLKMMSEYRISPLNPIPHDGFSVKFIADREKPENSRAEIDFRRFDEAMTRAIEQHHFTHFVLPIQGMGSGTFHSRQEPQIQEFGQDTPEFQAMFASQVQQIEAHLKEKGWLDKAYVYWFDEPDLKDYEFVKNGMNRIKQYAPGIPTMLTEEASDAVQADNLLGKVDIWCPLTANFDKIDVQKCFQRGEQLWWYVCCSPHAPFCTEFIDHNAIELRTWLWQTWKYNVTGILVWQSNYWTSDAAYPDVAQNPYLDPMSYVSGYSTPSGVRKFWGNGDGRFIYPPLSCATPSATPCFDAPVPSIRLAMLREGIEDYEMLFLLREKINEARNAGRDVTAYESLLTVPEEITRSLTEFNTSPQPIYARRTQIAEAIEALSAPAPSLSAPRLTADIVLADRLQQRGIAGPHAVIPPLRYETDTTLPPEAFSIEKTDSALILKASTETGRLYGMGRVLRGLPWDGSGRYFGPTGRFVPERPVRGVYFATHFGNYYHQAPVEEVCHYVEDLALMGCNALAVWFDMHHYTSMEDPAAQQMVARLHTILRWAEELGMRTSLTMLANEAFSTSPEEMRADGTGLSHYHVEICPNAPGGLEKILESRAQMLDAFTDLNLSQVWLWPYDQGGCMCEKCKPWGGKGFLQCVVPLVKLVREKIPNCQITLSTWEFGQHYPNDPAGDEWGPFYSLLETTPEVCDYVMMEERGEHGYHEMLKKRGVPGGKPLLNFPEISMLRMGPWGGFGANPNMSYLQKMADRFGSWLSGGYPYSEGIYEDLNKFVCLQGNWSPQRPMRDIVHEYMAGYLDATAADALTDAAYQLDAHMMHFVTNEADGIRYHLPQKPDMDKPFQTLESVRATLPAAVQATDRWNLLYCRALLDAELSASGGKPTPQSEKAFHILSRMYYNDSSTRGFLRVPYAQP